MKLLEAISLVDAYKPNRFTTEQKKRWLSNVDSGIFKDIIGTHEPDENTPTRFIPYHEGQGTPEDPFNPDLLAPEPYDIMYRYALEAQIDLGNMELAKYNNSSNLFNTAYAQYAAWYNRTHMPITKVGADHFIL